MTEEVNVRSAPADVHDLLARIDAAWSDFMAAIDGIPEDQLEAPGVAGEWSMKQLFGHIAFWDDEGVREIEQALAGQPRQENDWQAMNDADHAQRADRTLAEERSALHQSHAAMVARLAEVAGLEAVRLDQAVKGATYEHYEEHIPDVQGWRAENGF